MAMKLSYALMMAAGTMRIAGAPMAASVRLMGVPVMARSCPDSRDRELGGHRR